MKDLKEKLAISDMRHKTRIELINKWSHCWNSQSDEYLKDHINRSQGNFVPEYKPYCNVDPDYIQNNITAIEYHLRMMDETHNILMLNKEILPQLDGQYKDKQHMMQRVENTITLLENIRADFIMLMFKMTFNKILNGGQLTKKKMLQIDNRLNEIKSTYFSQNNYVIPYIVSM